MKLFTREIIESCKRSPFNSLFMMSIFLGIIFRIATFWTSIITGSSNDGILYALLGEGLIKNQDFVLPWDTVESSNAIYGVTLTYPLYLAFFYKIFGFTISTIKLAAIILSILLLVVVFLTSKDLFGKQKALFITAVISLNDQLIISTGQNYSENMLIIFFTLMIWSMIKSFSNEKYIPLAAFFAGLTYVSKTNIGLPLIVLSIILFIIYRFYFIKFKIFSFNYIGAGIIFFSFVISRNFLMQKNLARYNESTNLSFFLTDHGIKEFILQVPLHLILFLIIIIFLIPEFKSSINKINEFNSLLWLLIIGVSIPILIHATGRQTGLATIPSASARYFTLAYIPLLWLLTKHIDFDRLNNEKENIIIRKKWIFPLILISGAVFLLINLWWGILLVIGTLAVFTGNLQQRITLLLIALLIVSTTAIIPNEGHEYSIELQDAMNEFKGIVHDGDDVAIKNYRNAPLQITSAYIYLSEKNLIIKDYNNGTYTKYILSQTKEDENFSNYELIGKYEDENQVNLRKKIYFKLKNFILNINSVPATRTPIYLWKLYE